MLKQGQQLTTEAGERITVDRLLGSGGQGEVYRVRTPRGDRALKWYIPMLAGPDQWGILAGLIERGAPDHRFLWPESLVDERRGGLGSFGYLMELRPDRFRDLTALLRRTLPGVTMRSLVTACLHTVEAYRELHKRGIAYRDINWGNIFLDPVTGDVKICDNDNAVYEGHAAGVAGTMDFMAPELVRGDAGASPGTQADLHSLAVLLFLLLMNHFPFEGAMAHDIHCMDEHAKRKLLGQEPVFIYHPDDTRNRPIKGEQETVIALWGVTPEILQRLFVKTFTRGVVDPHARARETEWRDALAQVLDAIAVCPACDADNLTQPDRQPGTCWRCRGRLPASESLDIEVSRGVPTIQRGRIRIGKSAKLYAHHVVDNPSMHDFSAVLGDVVPHPKLPGRFGLTNRSASAWTVHRANSGAPMQVPPGRSASLEPGVTLEFGGGAYGYVRGY